MWQSISSADNLSVMPTIYLWCRQYICHADNLSVMPTIHLLCRQFSLYALTLIPCLYIWLGVCFYVLYMYKYSIQQELVGWDLPSLWCACLQGAGGFKLMTYKTTPYKTARVMSCRVGVRWSWTAHRRVAVTSSSAVRLTDKFERAYAHKSRSASSGRCTVQVPWVCSGMQLHVVCSAMLLPFV